MSFDYEILSQNDLLELFPFGRSKLNALLRAGVLPVTKVGRDYICLLYTSDAANE